MAALKWLLLIPIWIGGWWIGSVCAELWLRMYGR